MWFIRLMSFLMILGGLENYACQIQKKGTKVKYIKQFKDIRIEDVASVGGKNASLGQMISALTKEGILIPDGFAVTADAYWHFIDHNNLRTRINELLIPVNLGDVQGLQKAGEQVRALIKGGTMPDDLRAEITQAYAQLSQEYAQTACDVAVRSSATAEDLPDASFAGQQETFLNVSGDDELIKRVIDCMASLFTDRAIAYRIQKGFAHDEIALSVGVQKMIRSDRSVSGVAFSLDTESGFKDIVMIEASYGLGESIVQGLVVPDEYMVFKTTFNKGFYPLIKKRLGSKEEKIVYDQKGGTKIVPVSESEREQYCLTDEEIAQLTRDVIIIENHYSDKKDGWCPMDVEWAKDADDGKIYIVQSRPETVHSVQERTRVMRLFSLQTKDAPILQGLSIGQAIVTGTVRMVKSLDEAGDIKADDIIVTEMTDPDWVPLMKQAAGIITDRGGRTCHAAIVSRELEVPALVGTQDATTVLKDGQTVTIDCSKGGRGVVYDGKLPFEVQEVALNELPKLDTKVMVNIAEPSRALHVSMLPTDGVGLARIEFIINNAIKIHPMALVHPGKVTDSKVREQIKERTKGYEDKKQYFIDSLARGVAMIAAAFYPRQVIVRMSDFKTNEYRNLIGGTFFEPVEENPMLGFRGAFRYYNPRYQDAFALECAAMKKVREDMGLDNVTLMIPFVRTPQEGKKVLDVMAQYGLKKGENGLKIIMMCELPTNVILIDEFSKIFDGFSIGSNDLTQMTLGVDRDSGLMAELFDERDEAVMRFVKQAIEGAHRNNRSIGFCGQAPSDYPDFAQFLLKNKIDSLSLSPDTVIPFLLRCAGKKK